MTNADKLKAAVEFQQPLSWGDGPRRKVKRMKKKVVKRRVYMFSPDELRIIEEGLSLASIAARRDIETLNGASADQLEPHIARAVRLETLLKRVFKKR